MSGYNSWFFDRLLFIQKQVQQGGDGRGHTSEQYKYLCRTANIELNEKIQGSLSKSGIRFRPNGAKWNIMEWTENENLTYKTKCSLHIDDRKVMVYK